MWRHQLTSVVTGFVLRLIGLALLYLWLNVSTPLHKLAMGGDPHVYPSIISTVKVGLLLYVLSYLIIGLQLLLWKQKDTRSGAPDGATRSYRSAIVDVTQTCLLVLDIFAIYIVEANTGGAASPFRGANSFVICLAPLLVVSRGSALLVVIMDLSGYAILFALHGNGATVYDLVLEFVPSLAVFYSIVRLRESLILVGRQQA